MNNWEYTKDNRTDEQVKKDFEFGKANEKKVLDAVGYRYFLTNTHDEFKKTGDYEVDAFIMIQGGWWPVEVKYSKYKLKKIELKENQAKSLSNIGGLYIQGSSHYYSIVNVHRMMKESSFEIDTYCNKPCYRINEPKWIRYKNKIEFISK